MLARRFKVISGQVNGQVFHRLRTGSGSTALAERPLPATVMTEEKV